MTFDIIIGNTPYQELTDTDATLSKALWYKFIDMAIMLKAHYISMITPSRWFTGGQGLNQFRESWLKDTRVKELHHYSNSSEVFSNVRIAGGVSYFIWDRDKTVDELDYYNESLHQHSIRKLDAFDVFLSNDIDVEIVNKFYKGDEWFLNESLFSLVLPFRFYNVSTNWRGTEGDITVVTSAGDFKCKQCDCKNLHKGFSVVVGANISENCGASVEGQYKVITSVRIIDDRTVTTQTYINIGQFNSETEALNCSKYIKTKLLRFLVLKRSVGIHIGAYAYKFVPLQNFTESSDINWNDTIDGIDKQLYKKYNLSLNEIEYIESTIKSF